MNLFRAAARPGPWFGDYHGDWTRAHPGAWAHGTGACGSFCAGNVWVTGTPEFDREWFKNNGMKMPRRWKKRDMSAKPGTVRLASTLQPGESVSFSVDPETNEITNHGVHGGRSCSC